MTDGVPDVLVNDLNERMFNKFPEIIRNEDDKMDNPLKAWLSGICDIAGTQELIGKRFDYERLNDDGLVEHASDLADPLTSDESWLPWLAQMLGIKLNFASTIDQKRAQLQASSAGYLPGTNTAIQAAVKSQLTGEQYVRVLPQSTDLDHIGTEGAWDMLVITKATETVGDVVQAIINTGAKPAGFILHHSTFESSWDTLEAQRPTWAQWDNSSWQAIEETK